MKQTQFTISELFVLKKELLELLELKINLVAKYKLTLLLKEVLKSLEIPQKIKEELIKKYGTVSEEDSNLIVINPTYDDGGEMKLSESFINFSNEFTPILSQTAIISYEQFDINDFKDAESNSKFPIFFKLFDA